MTCPVPSQPGVGHLISRFSGLEGSKKRMEKRVQAEMDEKVKIQNSSDK